MNVNAMINRISNISMNEDVPDSETQARIVRYINDTYSEVYREIAKLYKNRLLTSETVEVVDGVGTLSAAPFAYGVVKDIDGSLILTATDIEHIDEIDVDGTGMGTPTRYFITHDTTLNTHPKNTTSVLVRVIPEAQVLSSASTEADIMIPVMFHEILIWGALFMMFLDERDTRTELEIRAAKSEYVTKLSRLKGYLANQPKRKIRITGRYI